MSGNVKFRWRHDTRDVVVCHESVNLISTDDLVVHSDGMSHCVTGQGRRVEVIDDFLHVLDIPETHGGLTVDVYVSLCVGSFDRSDKHK